MSYTLTIIRIVDPLIGKLYEWRLDWHGTTLAEGVVPWQGAPQTIRALIIRAARAIVPTNEHMAIVSGM